MDSLKIVLGCFCIAFAGIYFLLLFKALSITFFQKPPKIDKNVEWIQRPPHRTPCDRVYAGDMLDHLKRHATMRTVEILAHKPISLN